MATFDQVAPQVTSLVSELAKRAKKEKALDKYYEGDSPLPPAIVNARVTKAYNMLMGMANAPWAHLVVSSVENRLEVTGLSSDDKAIDDTLWNEVWQPSNMDSESKLAHNAALVSGRCFALVWPDETGRPEISLDNSSQMIVKYAEGSRRKRVAALRYWDDGDRSYATLYRPDGIYKFQSVKKGSRASANQIEWERRIPEGEEWPVENPFGVVPVVELAVNRRLKPGPYPYARGEFEHVTSLIDRINLLTFLGLVVAFWMGFPLRAVIGDKILRDDDGKPLPPFEIGADAVAQFENPAAKLDQFQAADRANLSIYAELDQLASITQTPRHYLPLAQGMTNLSADAIRASEGSLVAKIPNHKSSLGEAWEEVLRLAGLMLPEPVELSQSAELKWRDHETRSLAERADAATKLAPILPSVMVAEIALGLTAEQLSQMQAEKAGDVMSQLLAAATTPATPQIGAPATEPVVMMANGNGVNG